MTDLEIRRKRALYRSSHRGTKELDLMLGRFASARVPSMDDAQLAEFEQLLALPDPDIDLFMRGQPAPAGVAATVAEVRMFLGLKAYG